MLPSDGKYFGNLALQNLQELTLPDTLLLFPLAVAWYFFGVGLLLVLLWQGCRRYQNYKANAYRRLALQQLGSLIKQLDQKQVTPRDCLVELRLLLKATALQVFPRQQVAALEGMAWRDFLNATTSQPLFATACDELVGTTVYSPEFIPAPEQLTDFSRRIECWVLQHEVSHD